MGDHGRLRRVRPEGVTTARWEGARESAQERGVGECEGLESARGGRAGPSGQRKGEGEWISKKQTSDSEFSHWKI